MTRTAEERAEQAVTVTAHAAGNPLPPWLALLLAKAALDAASGDQRLPVQADGVRLTGQQAAVLRLAACGLSNAAIGARLFLSANTIKTHVADAAHALHADGRTHAVALAVAHGLLTPADLDLNTCGGNRA
jgi:DNA-binding NarL/FixJ family response regulator